MDNWITWWNKWLEFVSITKAAAALNIDKKTIDNVLHVFTDCSDLSPETVKDLDKARERIEKAKVEAKKKE